MTKLDMDADHFETMTNWLTLVVFNLTVGAVCTQYCIWCFFAVDFPWYWDMFYGLFLGQFAAPIAVISWIMRACGMEIPFVH